MSLRFHALRATKSADNVDRTIRVNGRGRAPHPAPQTRSCVSQHGGAHSPASRFDGTVLEDSRLAPLSQRTGDGSSASAPTAPTPFPTTTNTPATTSAGAALFPFPPQAERGVDDVGGLRELAEVRLEAWKGAPPSP